MSGVHYITRAPVTASASIRVRQAPQSSLTNPYAGFSYALLLQPPAGTHAMFNTVSGAGRDLVGGL